MVPARVVPGPGFRDFHQRARAISHLWGVPGNHEGDVLMARTLSPVPNGPLIEKDGRSNPDLSRWFQDVYYFVNRMLGRYDSDRGGTATLAAGTVTVANVRVTSATLVRLTPQTQGTARGHLWVTLNPGVGFTITSDNAADDRQIFYELTEAF